MTTEIARSRLPEVLVAAFAAFDMIAGLTGTWNGPQTMVEGLGPSTTHTAISTAIYTLDVTIVISALIVLSRKISISLSSVPLMTWRHLPWAAALLSAGLAWVELWYAATHHPRYVNGGPVASSVFVAYALWSIPLGQTVE